MKLPVSRRRFEALARSFAEVEAARGRIALEADRLHTDNYRLREVCSHYGIDPEELPRGWYSTSPTAIFVNGAPRPKAHPIGSCPECAS